MVELGVPVGLLGLLGDCAVAVIAAAANSNPDRVADRYLMMFSLLLR
jgi:hypothetical protein